MMHIDSGAIIANAVLGPFVAVAGLLIIRYRIPLNDFVQGKQASTFGSARGEASPRVPLLLETRSRRRP